MGSKSRINLGFIVLYILHFHRNYFEKSKIYMSKRIYEKIKNKHTENLKFINKKGQFKFLMQSTIASCNYDNCNDTINFISYIESEKRFILYSLKREKNHTICTTIFSLNKSNLRKYYKRDDFRIYEIENKKSIEKYINQVQ